MTVEQITSVLTWLISVAFPLLVGLVTTKETNPLLKVLLLATIAFASGFVSQLLAALIAGVPFNTFDALTTGAGAWVLALCSHREVWTRTYILDALQQIGVKAGSANKHVA